VTGVIERTVVVLVLASVPGAGAFAQQSVVDSVHNLSVSGPGDIRAGLEQQVCIFCHTPHGSASVLPLWNREAPVTPYTVYSSSALDAAPDQPTGSSKMCLSCHDGSIALGSVLSRNQVIQMAGVITSIPAGSTSNLGTDLSDDHPISFKFDSALAGRDPHLVDPGGLPMNVRMPGGELQCTTCHDPHDDSFGAFLVMDNAASQLCISCHRISETTITAHENCRACHQTHSAPSGPFLLRADTVTDTCVRCHDGSVPRAANILADLRKLSAHDTRPPVDTAEAGHATCTDCHDPHTMMPGPPASAPNMAANFGQVRPPAERGAAQRNVVSYEYEVCFRCHGDENRSGRSPRVSRRITQTSTRLQFDPSAVSFHPVMAPGRNTDVPSLRAGWTESSLVLCSDCHGSDTSRKAGGAGPDGVHGSNYPPILLERYETTDFTPESPGTYALCYRCHERDGANGILQDRSFPHRVHVVDARTPCSACHDAHGISDVQGTRRNNSHLINFDTSIVFPNPVNGVLEFVDQGTFSGSCTVSCHGVVHTNTEY
jgi:predicted CXXCH cytochrome family protein